MGRSWRVHRTDRGRLDTCADRPDGMAPLVVLEIVTTLPFTLWTAVPYLSPGPVTIWGGATETAEASVILFELCAVTPEVVWVNGPVALAVAVKGPSAVPVVVNATNCREGGGGGPRWGRSWRPVARRVSVRVQALPIQTFIPTQMWVVHHLESATDDGGSGRLGDDHVDA